MVDILYSIWENTFGLVYEFINEVLVEYGPIDMHLGDIPIKFGFGSIEWLNTDLSIVFLVVTSIIFSFIFIKLVYGVFKFFTKLVKRAFGGRKW